MAGIGAFGLKLRYVLTTAIYAHVTAGMKGAAGRGINRAGHFTAKHDALRAAVRVRLGNSREQGHGIGMLGILINLLCGGMFDDFAQIHNGNVITDVLDYR